MEEIVKMCWVESAMYSGGMAQLNTKEFLSLQPSLIRGGSGGPERRRNHILPIRHKTQVCVSALGYTGRDDELTIKELQNCSNTRLDDKLRSLCKEIQLEKAIDFLVVMDKHDAVPSENTYRILMKICGEQKALVQAKLIHSHFAKCGLDSNLSLNEDLLCCFLKCGSLKDALQMFQKLTCRTVFSWTAIINAYVDDGKAHKALQLHQYMCEEGVEPNGYTYVSLLKACTDSCNLEKGKILHMEARRKSLSSNAIVNSTLLGMYGKCGALREVEDLFLEVKHPDIVTYNVMLGIYAVNNTIIALDFYRKMQREGVNMNGATFAAILLACRKFAERECATVVEGQLRKVVSLQWVQEIHTDAWNRGFSSNLVVANNLLNMYGKCGDVKKAEDLFIGLPYRDIVSWTAMLSAYLEGGQEEKSILLYRQILDEKLSPDGQLFVIVIQACCAMADKDAEGCPSMKNISLDIGRALHADVKKTWQHTDPFILNTLIIMYGKCGSILEASNVFFSMPEPDIVSYNAMLSAYLETGEGEITLQFYQYMLQKEQNPDDWTFPTLLQACCIIAIKEEKFITEGQWIKPLSLAIGQALYADAEGNGLVRNEFVGISLINMSGKCGGCSIAEKVFNELSHSDPIPWNAMLSVYIEQAEPDKALNLYRQMQEEGITPSESTFLVMFQACCILAEEKDKSLIALEIGHAFHADAQRKGFDSYLFIGSILISMYSKCGCLLEAENAFCKLASPNIVAWNLLLSAYVDSKEAKKALQVLKLMQEQCVIPTEWTISIALEACCILEENQKYMEIQVNSFYAIEIGMALHHDALLNGFDLCISVGNSLISMYGRCGSIWEAVKVFQMLPQHQTDSWNEILSACIFHDEQDKALQMFNEMQNVGVSLDETTFVCTLQACCETGSIDICRHVHSIIASYRLELDLHIATTLIHAYGSCASMMDAQEVFNNMPEHDVVSWSALIAGYAREGNSKASRNWYNKMRRAHVVPNKVTFRSLLCACSHGGLIDEGIEYFESMNRDYGMTPETDHIVYMIDLIARAGDFSKVEAIFSRLSLESNAAIWLSLLGACQRHGNVSLGEEAFKRVLQMQPTHDLAYILMSNIYVDSTLGGKARVVENTPMRQCVEAL